MKVPEYSAKELFDRCVGGSVSVTSTHLKCYKGKCPICNDYKYRMYLKEYPDFWSIYCHNCSVSTSLEGFLIENFPHEWDYYKKNILKTYTANVKSKRTVKTNYKPKHDGVDVDAMLFSYLTKFSFPILKKQENEKNERYRKHCLKYVKGRKLSESVYSKFSCFYDKALKGYIGIPFYDDDGVLLKHIQGRYVFQKEGVLKYLFLKDIKEGVEIENKPFWGTWRVNKNKPVIINEGTLDGASFENGIAICGATISDYVIDNIIKKYEKRIWSVDNYWSDKEGKKLTIRLLEKGESCFIIPKNIKYKDANSILQNMFSKKEYIPEEFIINNTYKGKLGLSKLKLLEMKRGLNENYN